MLQTKGHLTLTLADDSTIVEFFVIQNEQRICLDREVSDPNADAHTVAVDITTPSGELCSLTGDQWRALEDEGNVDNFIMLLDIAPGVADIVVQKFIQAVMDEEPIYSTIVTRDETCSGTVFYVGAEDPIDVARDEKIELTLDEGNHKKYDDWSANDEDELDLDDLITEMLQEARLAQQAQKREAEREAASKLIWTIAGMTKDGEANEDGKTVTLEMLDSHDTLMDLIDECRRILA